MFNGNAEPIRLTNLVTGVIMAGIAAVIMYLQTSDWKAAAISALTAVSGLVAASEVGRQKVVSPETLMRETGKTVSQLS